MRGRGEGGRERRGELEVQGCEGMRGEAASQM